MKSPLDRLLVANRGEIAVRVIRSAREMGIRTIAVYSEADRGALHAALADEAVEIGPGEAALSYLDASKILSAAKATHANAIHPGYGFLSEQADFAEACRQAKVLFVGPSPEAMRAVGSKMEAKALAVNCGVPVVPGHFEPGATVSELRAAADRIGYPVLLKASAGGGGRGMREVRSVAEFDDAYAIATSEATKAFGDGSMMVEKLIRNPRHIEVQVLADAKGNVVCLYERECSIQRRHQKLIEESPTPFPGYAAMWPKMRDAARALMSAAGYSGAGTVEFIVDPSDGQFYFLEVNARLQVEHPVTELVTGLDLVSWQLRIARGEDLALESSPREGDRSRQIGHAIEARVVAEDPERGFLPSVGPLLGWALPGGPGIRVDTGYRAGAVVPGFYDSLLAKVIVHAETRPAAIRRLILALEDFHILGVKTNLAFLLRVLRSEEFQRGQIDTGLVDRRFMSPVSEPAPAELALVASAPRAAGCAPSASAEQAAPTAWELGDGFRNTRD